MEVLTLIFLWPFLVLVVGLAVISLYDALAFSAWWVLLVSLFLVLIFKKKISGPENAKLSMAEQLVSLRSNVIVFSLAILLPLFSRYLVDTFHKSLPAIIGALVLSFALVAWGMFMKRHWVLMYGNIIGGALSLGYVYSQLWALGELARIIAAGVGLLIAIVISVVKLKDKLV